MQESSSVQVTQQKRKIFTINDWRKCVNCILINLFFLKKMSNERIAKFIIEDTHSLLLFLFLSSFILPIDLS